jgi:hypothetical protein
VKNEDLTLVASPLEVKSNLRKKDLESAESAANHLHSVVYDSSGYLCKNYPLLSYKPLCGVIAFYGRYGCTGSGHDNKLIFP